jgi:hypothetical protein
MDECWFVLTQEHIDHPEFRNHFDLAGFSQAVSEITNGKIIIPINPTLKMGSIGPSVVMLQNKLNSIMGSTLNPDGSFGTKTRAEVIAFQSKYKLFTDGICGKNTYQAFSMIDIITSVCTTQGIEPMLGVAVASCESNLNPLSTLFNKPSNSTDRGLFQWNSVYHKEITDAQAFDPTQATELFCNAVKTGHLVEYWSASEPNWKKMLTPEILAKYNIK